MAYDLHEPRKPQKLVGFHSAMRGAQHPAEHLLQKTDEASDLDRREIRRRRYDKRDAGLVGQEAQVAQLSGRRWQRADGWTLALATVASRKGSVGTPLVAVPVDVRHGRSGLDVCADALTAPLSSPVET